VAHHGEILSNTRANTSVRKWYFCAVNVSLSEVNNQVAVLLNRGGSMIGRLGSTEAWVISTLWRSIGASKLSTLERKSTCIERLRIRRHAWLVAGIWPPTNSSFNSFKEEYLHALSQCDMLVMWSAPEFIPNEEEIASKFCLSAKKAPLSVLNPFRLSDEGISPWIEKLAGKHVLVVHREVDLVKQQYEKRSVLHKKFMIPNFSSLTTYRPSQTNGLVIRRKPWIDHLAQMKDELSSLTNGRKIDVAIVSAGAYGLPICAHLKTLGISSIYMGGITQMLFGIWGSRWRGKTLYERAATDAWTWPTEENRPFGYKLVERGSYW
jgi:hypothetical protein